MATLINHTSSTLYFTAQLSSGASYQANIPVGGGWTPPADVVAVTFHDAAEQQG